MIDSSLFFYLWTKVISIIVYIKNKLSSLAIQIGKIIPKKTKTIRPSIY